MAVIQYCSVHCASSYLGSTLTQMSPWVLSSRWRTILVDWHECMHLWWQRWITAALFSRVGPISGQLLQRLQSVFNAAARLVFSARKSEHITPLLPELLAESSRENSVPVMCSRVSLPYRHGAVIPCWDPPLNCRRRFTSTSPECFSVDAGHTDHTTHHAGWSSLPGDCCSSVECSFVVCSFCAIAAAVLPRPQESRRHCFSHRTDSVQLYDRL